MGKKVDTTKNEATDGISLTTINLSAVLRTNKISERKEKEQLDKEKEDELRLGELPIEELGILKKKKTDANKPPTILQCWDFAGQEV